MSKIVTDQLNATEAYKVPSYTEAQRDALTGVEEGFLIYNDTSEQLEIYYAGDWRNIGNVTQAGGGGIEALGGSVSTSGAYKIHTFANDDTFTVSSGGGEIEYLVIAGGGGGGGWGGGGGAGGYRNSVLGEQSGGATAAESRVTVQEGTYSIKVGIGGSRGTTAYTGGGAGADSSIIGPGVNIIAKGGAGGGWWQGNVPPIGGSGGGGSGTGSGSQGIAGQGTAGASGQGNQSGPYLGHGGGGGAGQSGSQGSGVIGGKGGDGLISLITGQAITRGGGGGGHSPGLGNAGKSIGGAGGGGGGGNYYNAAQAENGQDGTGGGGGGNYGDSSRLCGLGGKGIVIIRYPI